jgi:hypothetical protein
MTRGDQIVADAIAQARAAPLEPTVAIDRFEVYEIEKTIRELRRLLVHVHHRLDRDRHLHSLVAAKYRRALAAGLAWLDGDGERERFEELARELVE